MAKRSKTPYLNFPEISQEFIDEIFVRTKLCLDSLEMISTYQTKLHKNKQEFNEFRLIKYIAGRFVIIELFALFDGRGKLSIMLGEDKNGLLTKVQTVRLRKLFPSLKTKQFLSLQKKLESLFRKHGDFVSQLKLARNLKIAHAGISYFDDSYKNIKIQNIPSKQFINFIEEFQLLFTSVGFENDI
jgi:hypothetical protein